MFGFLAAASQDLGHAINDGAHAVAGYVGDVVSAAQNDPQLGGLVSNTVQNVRTDIANAVADAGAGLTGALAHKISPTAAPIVVPITKTAQQWLIAVAVLLVILLGVLAWFASRKK